MKAKTSNILRRFGISAATVALCGCLGLTAVLPVWEDASSAAAESGAENKTFNEIDASDIDNHIEDYFSESTVQKLSEDIDDNEEISLIIMTEEETVLDAYQAGEKVRTQYDTVAEYALSDAGSEVAANITRENNRLQASLTRAGVQYRLGNSYNTVIGGFEILVRARYFDQVCEVLDGEAAVVVGEVYERCETVEDTTPGVVTNDVNVYETGIFDSSGSEYDGSGVVVAVLDTGLDYTHSAFDVSRFEGEEVITLSDLQGRVGDFAAANTTAGLTAADVYLNAKVPYAYDYADGDPDVFPINSAHGTHVSGIIVGNDDTITGVAPNAQLAFMKVFSDETSGARTSWLLAALEDCVALGVDVINMSLGSSAGFSREVDEVAIQTVYDAIEAQGISLVAAASNDYNSTFGSTKNGNLGLTSNPDSATVGSPSTYEMALSVASVSGTMTPYLITSATGDTPIYITEAAGVGGEYKEFVDETLAYNNVTTGSVTLEYVVIPGVGRGSDYTGIDVAGKIALVRRGSTNFEDKARIARERGAAACIIFNNVSGDISMSVGAVGDYPVCSISQDDGEALVAAYEASGSGTITISTQNQAGPFMSNFSSWGPTPDLRIKPEITAHGGNITSAVPGGSYDSMSGTSMAAPNQAGVTALIRQYVKERFAGENLTDAEVTDRVYQIMMSTTDIVYNQNNLAYSVRKQGAGLANLEKATSTPAYVRTYDRDGELMGKTKLEIGDDRDKTGVYTMEFEVVNISGSALSYDVGAIVMTEGVSDTLTARGLTVVTEEGYLLSGASVSVSSVSGGSVSGNTISVAGNQTARFSVTITLSDEDKAYLDSSFENGMYVEGFITLDAASGTDIDLRVAYLGFYGDWTQAPLFDLDYFETDRDENDDTIPLEEKTLPDAYASRPIGGLYNDYIVYLGSYAFLQDPNATTINADRNHIALSNQRTGDSSGTVNSISTIYAGMLRGAKRMTLTITDQVTGEVIYEQEIYNQRKSNAGGGSTIYPSSIDVDFYVDEYDLKNNTEYMVTLTGYLDYGEDGGLSTNKRNTFSFPFVTDFQAPILTGVEYRTEYVRDTNTYRLYADLSIYDNHYSQGAVIGYIYENEPGSEYTYSLASFGRYVNALYSERNSTTVLTVELTDYMDQIKQSYNGNSYILQVYDYAQNTATYELNIPDSVLGIQFVDSTTKEPTEELTIGQYETVTMTDIVTVTPSGSWIATLNYTSSDESVVRVVNGRLIGVSEGEAYITATANSDPDISATLKVTVGPNEQGYSQPVAESFVLTGYEVNKVFYMLSSDERDLGATQAGVTVDFTTSSYSLSMFPSESVTLQYRLYAYFPDDTIVDFTSNNPNIVTVDEDGTVIAQAEGNTTISVRVMMWDPTANGGAGGYRATLYSNTVSVTVKDPYTTNSIYLMNYRGLGGEVIIPDDLRVTEIYQYAFSGYQYVAKDENDEISEEDPLYTKPVPIGDNTITKVVIPEGVEVIGAYAFANLTALEEVVLPSTLTKIQNGAFEGCTSLRTVSFGTYDANNNLVAGPNNLQFINNDAFYGCTSLENFSFGSRMVAIGDDAFAYTGLISVTLPATAQSIGAAAFYACENLRTLTINAELVKLGTEAFAYCSNLTSASINASVVPSGVFAGCTALGRNGSIALGPDVSVIGQYAFAETSVSSFTIDPENETFRTDNNGAYILSTDGMLVLVAPTATTLISTTITQIGEGVLAGNTNITTVTLPNVTEVDAYAFAGCTSLRNVTLGALTEVGDYAFINTAITRLPTFSDELTAIGDYAFAYTMLTSATIPANITVGTLAFGGCSNLLSVTVEDGATLEAGAFMPASAYLGTYAGTMSGRYFYTFSTQYASSLRSLTIGDNVTIGASAFRGSASLTSVTLGSNIAIGDYAFYNCAALSNIDLSGVTSVGDLAFSGEGSVIYYTTVNTNGAATMPYSSAYGWTYYAEGDNMYSTRLTQANLSNASEIGLGAFAYTPLTSVTLGENAVTVGDNAFYECTALTSVTLGGTTTVGDYAFYGATQLTQTDLSGISSIGAYAFYDAALASVTLAEGATVGDYAFYRNEELSSVANLNTIEEIGARAFAETALTSADLSAAVSLGDFAFADSALTEITLSDALTDLGENPFAGCALDAFERDGASTYDISANVRVIEGVLYRVAANGGLEVITYPIASAATTYEVEEGTIRIGARAFYNSSLISVSLVRDVAAIGDRAFYGCSQLSVIEFRSMEAPVLEEQYDEAYLNEMGENGVLNLYNRAPFTGNVELTGGVTVPGLGIIAFNMWNWSSNYTNYFYGANFIDLIGEETLKDHTLIMVRPNNGTGYDTFIYGQYFDVVIDGMTAITDTTLSVIDTIMQIPTIISLEHESLIVSARAAYNALAVEQQALVAGAYDGTNYLARLTSAEAQLEYLQNQQSQDPGVDPEPEPGDGDGTVNTVGLWIAIGVLAGVIVVLGAGIVAIKLVDRKKAAQAEAGDEGGNDGNNDSESQD